MTISEVKKNGKRVGWEVRVSKVDPRTKKKHQRRRRVERKAHAESLEFDLKQELLDIISGRKLPTWAELVADYEEKVLVDKAASTRHNELSILNHHANPKLDTKIVDEITEDDVREILNAVESNRSVSLRHNIRKCLANVFNYALDCRYITENPCRRVKLPKVPEPTLNILTDKQIKLFLKEAEKSGIDWFPIWAVAIYTGLRSGELIALRYRHIEHSAEKPVIRVQESWTKQGGYKPYTKNKRVRAVPINKEVQRVINKLKKANPDACNPDDFVLPQIPAWKQGDAAKELRAFLQGCGLPAIRFHDLRACFISQCLLHGVAAVAVMKMVDHRNYKTVMRYIRLTGSDVIGKTDVLDFSDDEDDEDE